MTRWSEIFEFFYEYNSEGMVEACGINVIVKSLTTVYDLVSIE